MRTALVTVSSESYLKGTQLMFYTFLKHHPEFDGDLVVLYSNLSRETRNKLHKLFGAECKEIDSALKLKLDQLTIELPEYKNRYDRFLSLQAFTLEYDSILFVDSDILFRKNITAIFKLIKPFSACHDLHSLNGGKRSLKDLSKQTDSSQASCCSTFNAGFFHFRPRLLQAATYKCLIEDLKVDQFRKLKSGHTDQYILNRQFAREYHLLDPHFNCYVTNASKIELEKAAIWHYLRHPKPWKFKQWIKKRLKGRAVPVYIARWAKLYQNFIKNNRKYFGLVKRWKIYILASIILLISSYGEKSE